jgi:3-isopropylmalate/(R)-2-methylmalate dehydratase small subunit
MSKTGKAWIFGDNIDTDVLAPGLYMKGPMEELARHCLETVNPDFAVNVQSGDVIVAGNNFGIGSSREQAVQALKILGISTLIARSFAGIFFRNALNFGVVALTCKDADKIRSGDQISTNPETGIITNHTTGETYACDPLPGPLLAMVKDGGLVEHLEKNLAMKGARK